MAWSRCEKCSDLLNIDNEPESYYFELESGKEIAMEFPLCTYCKEHIEDAAKKTVIEVRGSDDVPGFDSCVYSEVQRMLVGLVK